MPNFYEIDNLATVAQKFLSPAMLVFFISGGALLAVVTSINSAILMFSRSHFAAARDGLFPNSIMKINKYGAPGNSIWLNSVITILAMISGFNLTDVINITAIPGLLLSPIIFASVFALPYKFPNSYKTSFLKIPHWINCLIVIIASVLSILMGSYVLKQMQPKNYIIMIAFYIVAAIYTYLRIKYLKDKKGLDMIAKMKEPYQPWIDRERQATEEFSIKNSN
jgi:amino acid transporter